jgi:hypothetical protein
VFLEGVDVVTALVLDIRGGKIVAVRTVSNPDKLAHLSRGLAPDHRKADGISGPENATGPPSREASGYEPEPAPSDLR